MHCVICSVFNSKCNSLSVIGSSFVYFYWYKKNRQSDLEQNNVSKVRFNPGTTQILACQV